MTDDVRWVHPPLVESNGIATCRSLPPVNGRVGSMELNFEDRRSMIVPYDRLGVLLDALGLAGIGALVNVPVEVRSDAKPGFTQLSDSVYVGRRIGAVRAPDEGALGRE